MKECKLAWLNIILIVGAVILFFAGFYAWAEERGLTDHEINTDLISVENGTRGTLVIHCRDGHERYLEVKPLKSIKAFPYSCKSEIDENEIVGNPDIWGSDEDK